MKPSSTPIVKDLVLIGGGHSHVTVLKRFGMRPLPGLRLTLITRDVHTPYSGMLPGYIAGHYSYDDCHIDLRPLTLFAGGRLIHATVESLDLANKRIHCGNRPPVPYDILSVNTGSRPYARDVPGAAELALPVKPIDNFLDGWDDIMTRVVARRGHFRLGVVGGGAGGVELTLATQYHLRNLVAEAGYDADKVEHHLITGSAEILPTHNAHVRERFQRVLRERGVHVYLNHRAVKVEPGAIHCDGGKQIEVDGALWVTNASAPAWLAASGLATDDAGFVRVNDYLQSTSHPEVFAAGDIASSVQHPRPKSGVFAVRQGPQLAANLRRAARSRRLVSFTPQSLFLSLISTGDKYAVASWGNVALEGAYVWRWKDWIDRRFMTKFNELPEMASEEGVDVARGLADEDAIKELSAIAMRCGGCGAKVGSTVLSRVVNRLDPVTRDDVLIGLQAPDDAAVVEVPPGKALVQSVDYFRAFVDDPYLFGRIAANHSLGDIFAMGAEGQSAMAIATVPYGREAMVEEQLYQMMAGALEVLNDADTALVGGHSSEGAELAFGLSVTGLAEPAALLRKGGMSAGQALILTKPLGTGTLFAADMRQKAKGRWISAAIDSMLVSNQAGAACVHRHGASACTDVTGFGLLGHLVEMTRPSNVDAEIDLDALPILDGARETIRAGVFSSLQPQNVRLRRAINNTDAAAKHENYPLLFDPQTAGGLLASVPAESAAACLAELHGLGYTAAAIVGLTRTHSDSPEPISLIARARAN